MNTIIHARVKGLVESKNVCESAGSRHAATRIRMSRAEAALKAGDLALAAVLAEDILRVDANHLAALETYAKALWSAGRYEQVVAATDKLLSLNPYEPGYHALRGAALHALGRYGEACESYDRSSELPHCAEALRELQTWQARLLLDLLQTDPVFKVSYRQNPRAACEARGFRFVEHRVSEAWHPSESERNWSYTRPS